MFASDLFESNSIGGHFLFNISKQFVAMNWTLIFVSTFQLLFNDISMNRWMAWMAYLTPLGISTVFPSSKGSHLVSDSMLAVLLWWGKSHFNDFAVYRQKWEKHWLICKTNSGVNGSLRTTFRTLYAIYLLFF